MARLIDADKINYHEHTECMGHGDFETIRTITDKEIAEIPTVDAVEVVRCRECKYHEDTSVTEYEHCCLLSKTVRHNDFCSYGDRKEGAGNG